MTSRVLEVEDVVTGGQKISLQLIDLAKGRTLQTWRFDEQTVIRIGRSEKNDVVIADPYASRFHAELHFQEGRWLLVSLGRHGTLVKGEKVNRFPLDDGTQFQLGSTGPAFRFQMFHTVSDFETTSMVTAVTGVGKALQVDVAVAEQHVQEIAATPYFQKLQQFTENLRGRPRTSQKSAKAGK